MALRVSATMALFLVFSLMAVAHCAPLKADLATNASSIGIPAAEVLAVPDEQGLLRLPYSEDNVVPVDAEEAVKPVAEPDPDRSHPSSNGEEELTAKKPATEGQQGDEKTKGQIDDDEGEDEGEEEKKTKKKNQDDDDKEEKKEKKKRKKHHDGDGKGKKEKKTKKHHQSNDDEEEEEKTKKHIHRHHHEKEKTKKRPHHINNGNDDSDDEDEQVKKAKRWRKKAISRSRFGHGRRSQREEAQTEEVKN